MTGCMNKKQISCLVAGLFCSAALIALCIWAGVGGLFQKLKSDNLQTKNVSLGILILIFFEYLIQICGISGDGPGTIDQR